MVDGRRNARLRAPLSPEELGRPGPTRAGFLSCLPVAVHRKRPDPAPSGCRVHPSATRTSHTLGWRRRSDPDPRGVPILQHRYDTPIGTSSAHALTWDVGWLLGSDHENNDRTPRTACLAMPFGARPERFEPPTFRSNSGPRGFRKNDGVRQGGSAGSCELGVAGVLHISDHRSTAS